MSVRPRNVGKTGQEFALRELDRLGFSVQEADGAARGCWRVGAEPNQELILRIKAAGGGAWQYPVDHFLRIDFDTATGVQRITGRQPLKVPEQVRLFVSLGKQEGDAPRCFLCTPAELQQVVFDDYSRFLERHGGVRPQSPSSLHVAVWPKQLEPFENRWNLLRELASSR